jgi:hypothetical protein
MHRPNRDLALLAIATAISLSLPGCHKEPAKAPEQSPGATGASNPAQAPIPEKQTVQQNSPAPGTANAAHAEDFVPMPDDIDCVLDGMNMWANGGPGDTVIISGSVGSMKCRVVDKGKTAKRKPIPLASPKFKNGILPTRDFGNIRISVPDATSPGVALEIDRSRLDDFRRFLSN